MLQKHGVDYAQGYFVGKPAPIPSVLAGGAWMSEPSSSHAL